jgi:hypothetical protein
VSQCRGSAEMMPPWWLVPGMGRERREPVQKAVKLNARYESQCSVCGGRIHVGDRIKFFPGEYASRHNRCGDRSRGVSVFDKNRSGQAAGSVKPRG